MHLMALGMFLFEIGTLPFEELQRRASWTHARSARIGARDAVQFVGVGEETITLSGATYTELADGRVSLDELTRMADTGDRFPLLDGTGTIFGDFVIEQVDQRHTALLPDGTPRRIDFGIDLLRVDDPSDADKTQVQA